MDDGDALKRTYRYLRLALLLMVGLLGVSLFAEAIRTWTLLDSVSQYYHTPVRSVFVGSLTAVGACLIIIKGVPDSEDTALNVAGMLAPVVAFVPVPPKGGANADWTAAIDNNVIALLVIAVIGLALALWMGWRAFTATSKFGLSVAGAVIAVGVIVYFADRDLFFEWAHWTAAALLFVALGVVAFLKSREPGVTSLYRWVWIGMLGAAAVFGALRVFGWNKAIFLLEVTEIALFFLFWCQQTLDTWGRNKPNVV